MATVYLARDLRHDRPVALKVLHPGLAVSLGSERFLREIRIAARLQHPYILPLFDSGDAGGILYYVMPYVEGESLRVRLQRGHRVPVSEALRLARTVAVALDYAHRQHVIHRDIKPENVMLHEGEAMVTDFGIAKAVSAAGSETLTQIGTVVGTPAYMSPEQAAGEPELDGRTDIYSLGCVLYELLAGEPPFTGGSAQSVLVKRFTDPVPSVRAVRPDVPEAVERLIRRALAKEPAERFANAGQLAEALAAEGAVTPRQAAGATSHASPAPRSIAVLPFANMSADPANEFFTDGIAEEITNALVKIQALRVAARTSAFAYKGKSLDIRQIGQQLGVDTLLEGSVRKRGSRLRISAQLINVANGYHLWSERYDREVEDVFAIQDEIAQNVVQALRVVLSEHERRAMSVTPAADVRAYEYYLRGRQLAHQHRRKSYEHALQMFVRAIEIDPGYARAYAGMADCYSWLYMYLEASEANLEQADAASRKALELDPDSAEAHASRGHAISLSKRFDEAHAEFETAIRLAPTLFEAHYLYARACWAQGLLEEAARHFEDACEVRPEDYQAPCLLGTVYDGLGEREKADSTRRRALAASRRHLELYPDDVRALYLGAGMLRQLGEEAEATEWASRVLAMASDDPAVYYNLACFYALGGNSEEALGCLERAVKLGYAHREWLEHDADLVSVREHPR
ncbi:MAG: protein kinase, partial [Chloroflexota bacterium]|nr:protein kinase [Chloroflexota bacterium]